MENITRRLLAFSAGALFVLSGIAMAQDSTTPSGQMRSPQGSMQDTMRTQGSMQDTTQIPGDVQQVSPMQGGRQDTLKSSPRDSVQGSTGESVAPDNTGINKRDRNDNEMTADEQGQSAADIEMTRKIRRTIMEDDSLSTYAKNIKIITKDGMVTLKGPVRSEQEKSSIEAKAASVAGTGKIKNQIEVKAANKPKND